MVMLLRTFWEVPVPLSVDWKILLVAFWKFVEEEWSLKGIKNNAN